MELKKYQKKVIEGLNDFLTILNSSGNVKSAYKKYWEAKEVTVGYGGLPSYKDTFKSAPHVCFKVPTGGGKTYLACASIKPIFDAMTFTKTKTVVWLVPSDPILDQTIKALSDINHPYRQKIDNDFNGRVEVYTKNKVINGQNFNPTTVNEQLSIIILSYDSFRAKNKESRKIYQENGSLSQFAKFHSSPETLIQGVDESALIQVINQLNPVVIVDESHNAETDLSIEMLTNLNPSFVLDLTATPRNNSNIIYFVDAIQLKNEHMVKLPVVVFNRQSMQEVISDAIDLRNNLEVLALKEAEYIRPIVLFQAQPKGKEKNETFEKLKQKLIDSGIPSEQIAIKTSNINEIKSQDLISKNCEVRYIITVNALKEGWDCPFAYILATLANKTSKVDVEQILGRVLRQPYTINHKNKVLNMSYVLTSSNDFRNTLNYIVKGLNKAGFTKHEVGLVDDMHNSSEDNQLPALKQESLFDIQTKIEEFLDFDTNEIKGTLEQSNSNKVVDMITKANFQSDNYDVIMEQFQNGSKVDAQAEEVRGNMNISKINDEFKDEALSLCLPQFFIKVEENLFIDNGITLLSKEFLSKDFTLWDKDISIDFTTTEGVQAIDVEITKDGSTPKFFKMNTQESKYIKEFFSSLPAESKINICKDNIYRQISKIDTIDDQELRKYIDRVVANMNREQIEILESMVYRYGDKIKNKIISLQEKYMRSRFNTLLEQGKIICKENYGFKSEISPINSFSSITKSLYTSEGNINNLEYKVITEVASLENVKWWHRNTQNIEFNLNGFINHYPDFIVLTNSGKIVLIETKGDFLANDDSIQKLEIGRAWQNQLDEKHRYYMVFESKEMRFEGAYQFDDFIKLLKGL